MAACLPRICTNDVSQTSWAVALARVFEQGTIVPLRVELKPFERIVIGETVLINSGTRTSFLIDGEAPILRERDTITAETANTPAKRLYLCVQTMYLKNDIPRYRTAYQGFLRELRDANPGARLTIDAVNSSCFRRRALQGAQGNQEADEARRRTAGGLIGFDSSPRSRPSNHHPGYRPFAVEAFSARRCASRRCVASSPRTAGNDIIHLLRICTDSEINVAVKPERLCLTDDRYI